VSNIQTVSASYSIQAVAERTGLTAHVIRAWERRYGAIEPARSRGRHRLYGEAEIDRLSLLQRAIRAGHSIGQIANLPTGQLHDLVAQQSGGRGAPAASRHNDQAVLFRERILQAVGDFSTPALQDALQGGLIALGHQGLLRLIVAPLAQEIGDRWHDGELTAAHEHFFTATVKAFLGNVSGQLTTPEGAPRIVVGTPAGQVHELGAVLAAAEASHLGWNVVYLGPNLPAGEIAGAAVRHKAAAVALSIVYPDDDPKLPDELERLARFLPSGTRILAGGRAAASYLPTLLRMGAICTDSLEEFSDRLDALRRKTPESAS
jgi:MerR family transcriptional regulator, light-induced transcriptional regulator